MRNERWLYLGLIILLLLGFWTYTRYVEGQKVAFASGAIDERLQGMLETLRNYGITDPKVLEAMSKVRRHSFIPTEYLDMYTAYGDHPCPIGHGQTISQPYIVAYMTEKMHIQPGEKILEIGTGSGYQAAVLAQLGGKVFSVEIVPELAVHARKILLKEGFAVEVLQGDGYKGWPEKAPFDVVIVTCAPTEVPKPLIDQMKEGGRMILPLGDSGDQRLVVARKKDGKVVVEEDLAVRFVPMVHGNE